MTRERREHRTHGPPVLVEGYLTDEGDVHLEWRADVGAHRELVATADGGQALTVAGRDGVHPPFAVVANDLLRR